VAVEVIYRDERLSGAAGEDPTAPMRRRGRAAMLQCVR